MQVPGPRQVVGQEAGKIESVKATRLHPIVGDDAAHGGLAEEEQRHHREVKAQYLLAGGEHPVPQSSLVGMAGSRSTPTQVIELSEHEQDEPQPTQERDQAHGAPEVG